MNLRFEAPPPRPSRPGAVQDMLAPVLREMKKHPNEWVRMVDYDTKRAMTVASELRRAEKQDVRPPWMPPGKWEFQGVDRKRVDGQPGTVLYGRFLG